MEILPRVKKIYDRFQTPHTRVATSTNLIGQRWTIFGAGQLWVLQHAGEEFKVERTVCCTLRLLVSWKCKPVVKRSTTPLSPYNMPHWGNDRSKEQIFDPIRSTLIELTLSNPGFISVTHKYHTQAQYQLGQF